MPRSTLCYRYCRSRFSRKPLFHAPCSQIPPESLRHIKVTRWFCLIFNRTLVTGKAGGFTIAGPSKGPDRNRWKPSAILPFVADLSNRLLIASTLRISRRKEKLIVSWIGHTPGNVKLLLSPRHSRGFSIIIRATLRYYTKLLFWNCFFDQFNLTTLPEH